MFLLVSLAWFTGLVGFACPPLWIITFFCVRGIVKVGKARHAETYRAAEQARMKLYLSWSK